MKDRLSEKPGRVELRYDDGTTVEVTMTRKDEPAEVGSAYCKANVLPDDVCTLLGIDQVTGEPKDAFQTLKTVTNNLSTSLNTSVSGLNTAINTKCKIMAGYYTGNSGAEVSGSVYSQLINLGARPKAVLVLQWGRGTSSGSAAQGGLAVSGLGANPPNYSVEITSNGFYVYNRYGGVYANSSGIKYTYMAFL